MAGCYGQTRTHSKETLMADLTTWYTQMIVDYRATQGADLSALLAGTPQP